MNRGTLVLLAVGVLAIGGALGYFLNRLVSSSGTGNGSAEKTGGAKNGAPETPEYRIHFEDSKPLLAVAGADQIWGYKGGPAWVHVQYFVDFEQNGVKKRAFFQAFNSGIAAPVGKLTKEGYYDLKGAEGVVALSDSRRPELRTAYFFPTDQGSNLSTSDDVFDSYQLPATDPTQALVLDFAKVEKTSLYPTPAFYDKSRYALSILSVGPLVRPQDKTLEFWRAQQGKFAGQKGVVVLFVTVLPQPNQVPATEETFVGEVGKLRRDLAAKPGDAVLTWQLAHLLDFQRFFVKQNAPLKQALAKEALNLLRETTQQEPGNMFYRAQLRRLLLRQAGELMEAKQASAFPKLLDEVLSLVPLYDSEYHEAARLLSQWQNPELATLPEGEKQRILQETDKKVVKLLRRYAEIWQNHPEKIRKTLEMFEREAASQSYAATPEFRELLENMRSWLKKEK